LPAFALPFRMRFGFGRPLLPSEEENSSELSLGVLLLALRLRLDRRELLLGSGSGSPARNHSNKARRTRKRTVVNSYLPPSEPGVQLHE
jgi:hypothetical protein